MFIGNHESAPVNSFPRNTTDEGQVQWIFDTQSTGWSVRNVLIPAKHHTDLVDVVDDRNNRCLSSPTHVRKLLSHPTGPKPQNHLIEHNLLV